MPTTQELLEFIAVEQEKRRRDREKMLQTTNVEEQLFESIWVKDGDRYVKGFYVNRDTSRAYRPHHDSEATFVFSDRPRYILAKGGEGGGKSVAAIIKTLERVRRSMTGIMGSPDFEHFKRSLWPEFQRWCPPASLVRTHRARLKREWVPQQPFVLSFLSGANLYCGGFDDPTGWEGPNVSFAVYDEARRHKTPAMLKVLDGRCRIPGPNGEPPQIAIATTPAKHWLYEYFGPWTDTSQPDPLSDFKAHALVIDLLTVGNASNLAEGFVDFRGLSLSEAEKRVLLEAAWEDIEDTDQFLPHINLWDAITDESMPPIRDEPVILAVDAATGRRHTRSDCFAVVGVTRRPGRWDDPAIRFTKMWQAPRGGQIDFRGTEDDPGPERFIQLMRKQFNVVCMTYDPTQLVDMAQRLTDDGLWCDAFMQTTERGQADRLFLDVILNQRLSVCPDPILRSHIANSDRKNDDEGRKLRIVKGRGNIDLAVAGSMGVYRCLSLNV